MADDASATDVAGVAKEWDSYEDIRERLRGPGEEKEEDKKKESTILASGPACQDISTSVKQKSFLGPLLSKMALTVKRPVPGIDQLKDEIQSLLQMNKRGTDFDWDDVAKAGWCLRKLCGFVKAKCRRREVSTATRLTLKREPSKQVQDSYHIFRCFFHVHRWSFELCFWNSLKGRHVYYISWLHVNQGESLSEPVPHLGPDASGKT